MVNLQTELCGHKLANPTVLASGFLGLDWASLDRVAKSGAGAVTTKSCNLEGREGYNNPTVLANENFMLNAIGLANAGVESEIEELQTLRKKTKAIIIGSVFENSPERFGEVVKRISTGSPHLIELDLSCPHLGGKGFEKYHDFASDPALIAETVQIAKKNTKIPIFAKLSPNVPNIADLAVAAEKAGADGITAINTAGGMLISPEFKKPILHNKFGGVSGPAIKPIALKCVYQCFGAVKIPIIGTGGVTNGKDAIEMLMAGAAAVGVGTATYYRGIDAFKLICDEMEEWMQKNGYDSAKELIGAAHG
ncbi:MAG TPA: dihydroorotate dehydrogenase [Candidatus Norongarragalinales archaeon]|nr:dihydroorotate dehydrogenase [Candidatus Norongarragalinales archaeon]